MSTLRFGCFCLALGATLLASIGSSASVPARIPVQGALSTADGIPASDGKYSIIFRIYDSQTAAVETWIEIHVAVKVAGGGFSADLGSVSPKNPLPVELFAGDKELWLGVQVSDDPELPRVLLQSVPYAIRATYADGLVKPITGDLIAPGSLGAAAVGFTYASSATKGGPANDLECTGCVSLAELAAGVLAAGNVSYDSQAFTTVSAALDGAFAALGSLEAALVTLQAALHVSGKQVGIGVDPGGACGLDVGGATCVNGTPVKYTYLASSDQDMAGIKDPGQPVFRTDTERLFVFTTKGFRELVYKPMCGDGSVEPGEECDDGAANANAPDTCRTACVKPKCGDKIADSAEGCDDGNADDTDACIVGCKLASCGDGHVYSGVEECDDGNGINTDACVQGCKKATCGDGYLQAGVEQCDNGVNNANAPDKCRMNCNSPKCGDNILDTGEDCDDGNSNNGDGCSNICKKGVCSGLDAGNDKLIYVSELNACLKAAGAAFYSVQWIEVAYGHTDYLDNVCKAMGYAAYAGTHGGDQCGSSANMYPSHCGQGWLGSACGNGCGNTNYDAFYCQ